MQIKHTGESRLDGAILCPACGHIHGRCVEAMYPFLHLAQTEQDETWIIAADQLFIWAEHTISQPDGSYYNDIDSDWKGTTVFHAIQLAECLILHGALLPEETKGRWKKRLVRAAEFLYAFDELKDNNINYPISNALALYECGLLLKEERYIRKARELASMAEQVITGEGHLIGEGIPHLAYDWEYLPEGHVNGGTLSLLHHNQVGTILCAGMCRYTLKEPNNMQVPYCVRHECLALRIEAWVGDVLYSSLYEDSAQVTAKDNSITTRGYLKDSGHNAGMGKKIPYCFSYRFEENRIVIHAEYATGMLICPLVSEENEEILFGEDGKSVAIRKEKGTVKIQTSEKMELPYGNERIFNLVPGLQALRIDLMAILGSVEIQMELASE